MVAEQNDPRVSAPARCSTGGFANLGSEAIACTNATLTWEVLTSSPNPASQTYHSHARGCRCVQIIKFGHCVVFQDDARSHFGWRFHFSLPIRNQESWHLLFPLLSLTHSRTSIVEVFISFVWPFLTRSARNPLGRRLVLFLVHTDASSPT